MPEVEKISISGTPIDIVDKKVVQTPTTTNANYEILFSGTADNIEHTEGVRKHTNAIINPGQSAFTFGSRASGTVGAYSFAEGMDVVASGGFSHAEGLDTIASGVASHAEGSFTTASNQNAHAEGASTTASGYYSHAEGYVTTANHRAQHVFGEYNIADDSLANVSNRGTYVEIVGNGTSSTASNARTLDWDGNEVLAGKLTVGAAPTANMDVATKKYVDDADAVINANLAQLSPSAYSTTGLQYSNVSYSSGGYVKIGKLVIVNLRVSVTSATSAGIPFITGFPIPLATQNTVAVTNNKLADMTLNTSGAIGAATSLTSGSIIMSCAYICA